MVDDKPVNLEVVKGFLEGLGLELVFCESGNEALEKISEVDPDLVILNLMMPEIDGYAVIRQLRSEFTPLQLPILVVTANEQEWLTPGP